ncbi:MAG: dTDP-4-dehydrorhamnose reductase [bacterium]|nr:dTDP-4-dehydrorhamnose reductase [bacterium]
MKIMIIGANGQLGTDLAKVFKDEELILLTHQDIEITSLSKVMKVVKNYSPEVIINTAAYHNLSQCEENPEMAFEVNALGVRKLAKVCDAESIELVHISTDYVFDGNKKVPYVESDCPNPLNTYGISKLAGEFFAKWVKNHYIVRVAGLFGTTGCRAKGGMNFVETMLKLTKTREEIEVTSNVFCSPTYTVDAAMKIKELITGNFEPGIYHVTNRGECSWYEFAKEIFDQAGLSIKVLPKEEISTIRRPEYSVLASEKIQQPRDWKEALGDYLKERKVV